MAQTVRESARTVWPAS